MLWSFGLLIHQLKSNQFQNQLSFIYLCVWLLIICIKSGIMCPLVWQVKLFTTRLGVIPRYYWISVFTHGNNFVIQCVIINTFGRYWLLSVAFTNSIYKECYIDIDGSLYSRLFLLNKNQIEAFFLNSLLICQILLQFCGMGMWKETWHGRYN